METTTPFDLNQAIQRWRENLAQSPAFRSENLYELEVHLRDSVAALQTDRLSADEAFIVAVRRIGTGDALGIEFSKLNRQAVWFDRMLWVLIGFQISLVVFDACRTVSVFSKLPSLDTSPILGIYSLFTGGALERNSLVSSMTANSVLVMPLVTVVLAYSFLKFSQGPENPAWRFSKKLLKRPFVLGFAFLLFGMITRFLSTSFYVFLFSEPSRQIVVPGLEVPATYPITANVLVQLPQYALCAILTAFVARKRHIIVAS